MAILTTINGIPLYDNPQEALDYAAQNIIGRLGKFGVQILEDNPQCFSIEAVSNTPLGHVGGP